MQVGFLKIYDPFTPGILHIGIFDVPFQRDRPVKCLIPAGNFMDLKRDMLLQDIQCPPDPVPRNAAAIRI
jgi:hypothetical protein